MCLLGWRRKPPEDGRDGSRPGDDLILEFVLVDIGVCNGLEAPAYRPPTLSGGHDVVNAPALSSSIDFILDNGNYC